MLNRCLDDSCECSRGASGHCKYQDAFREVSEMVNRKLESYKFDELIK